MKSSKIISGFLIVFIIVSAYFIFDSINQTTNWIGIFKLQYVFDLSNNVNVPTYLAFFASAISAFLIYQTLNSQKESGQLAAFENRFFKFIDYHRENVNQLKARNPKVLSEQYRVGTQVFTTIFYEINDLLKEYLKNKHRRETMEGLSVEEKTNIINFIYQCVFYGAGVRGKEIIKKNFEKKINFSLEYSYIKEKFEKTSEYSGEEQYYSGHVRRLGHYFRNIYQTVQYLEQQKFLSYNEKYEYMAAYRAQMSVYEQAVFFFNSVSDLGRSWELGVYDGYKLINANHKMIFNKLLITKYDLIRNTISSDGFVFEGLKINEFYPLLNLEKEDEILKSGLLKFKDSEIKLCRYCYNIKYLKYTIDQQQVITELDMNTVQKDEKVIVCSEKKCKSKSLLKQAKSYHINNYVKV